MTPDRTSARRLRILVAAENPTLYAWQRRIVDLIHASDGLQIVLFICGTTGEGARVPSLTPQPVIETGATRRLRRLIERLERGFDCSPDAFAVDAEPLPFEIAIHALNRSDPNALVQALEASAADIDVALSLDGDAWNSRLAPIARHGCWMLRHETGADAATAAFLPVLHGSPIASWLEIQLAGEREPRTAFRTWTGINRYSIKITRSELCWKASALPVRALEVLRREGADRFFARTKASRPGAGEKLPAPSSGEYTRHVGRNLARRTGFFFERHFMRDGWFLLYRRGDALPESVEGFQSLHPPSDRYWADPHVLRRDDRYYVFIEEFVYATAKGHLSVLSIDADGRHTAPETVLEKPYHLSYPHVFEDAGTLYMVPESSANRTVDLYRCTGFPTRWEHVTTLLEGVSAVDATLTRHHGKWWMFANVAEHAGVSTSEELFIFHARSLEGPWLPHAANPVVSDVRSSRPAGAILVTGDRLYRPAQDCSVRYGYAITLNRIDMLTEDDYRETAVRTIRPDWAPGIVATHTLGHAAGLTVLDAQRPRFRR